jgi:hypothetical protein
VAAAVALTACASNDCPDGYMKQGNVCIALVDDGGASDAGRDAGRDTGPPDMGPPDAGQIDMGGTDLGFWDTN